MTLRSMFALIAFVCLFSSCSDKLDLTANYKEIPVVYGLLDYSDATHYIRVQKGYLLDGDAYAAAANPDSIYYGSEMLVSIKELVNGRVNRVFNLQRVDGRDYGLYKDSGTFANQPNILYRFAANLDPAKKYRLMLNNTNTLLVDSAEIDLVRDFTVSTPIRGSRIALQDQSPSRAIWYTAQGGAIYDVTIRFPFNEFNLSDNSFIRSSYVDVPLLRSFEAQFNDGSQQINNEIYGATFLRYLANNLTQDAQIYRVFDVSKGMRFTYAVGGVDLLNYFKVQQAQSGLGSNDALPPYTNLKNGGYGIFTSRHYKIIDSVLLNNNALDSLACSNTMKGYNFRGSVGQICN